MTVGLYWWRPTRPARSLATELRWHAPAWASLLAHGGGMSNFGDELSPLVVSELTTSSKAVRWAPLPSADLVAIGSVLNRALHLPRIPIVFGSGLRGTAGVEIPLITESSFVMVRGSLTRDALGLPTSTPLGDPGIIAREIFPVAPRVHGSRRPVFVPHFAMMRTRAGRALVARLRRENWEIVLPNATPVVVASAIARAPLLITTSLHALVFAHSYGTPAALLEWKAALVEPTFKYEDYASSLGIPLARITTQTALAESPVSIIDSLSAITDRVSLSVDSAISRVYKHGRDLV